MRKKCGIGLQEGVYVQFTGPAYETPAEVRMAAIWGGDAVGMSTACEAMAARHMGIEVCGIFLYHQHGSWHFEAGAEPQGGSGDCRQSGEIF